MAPHLGSRWKAGFGLERGQAPAAPGSGWTWWELMDPRLLLAFVSLKKSEAESAGEC